MVPFIAAPISKECFYQREEENHRQANFRNVPGLRTDHGGRNEDETKSGYC